MEEKYQEVREFSRVNAIIPLAAKLISSEERQRLKARVSGEISFILTPTEEPMDKALAQWVKVINSKLDYFINLWSFREEGFCSLPMTPVNISGGGMSFVYDVFYKTGDIIELKTVLEAPAPVGLYLYGEVIDCQMAENNTYRIHVKFVNIEEDIRDYIIKFVFYRQRQILRQKREV